MSTEIWVAIITGIFSFLCAILTLTGVIITTNKSNKKQNEKVDEYKNLTVYRIEQLEKKQDIHNGVIERVYIGEGKINELQHEVKDLKEEIRIIKKGD